jgi:SAM-dependent methyltransferase
MKKYLFVDEKQNIYTGEEAREKIAQNSDKDFLEEGKGVIKVSPERWKQAQSYERHFWMERAKQSDDDRNIEHFNDFGAYASIKGLSFNSAIELGCGPFTNLRIIATQVKIGRCTLEDPLIDDYLKHAHTTYNQKFLNTGDKSLDPILIRMIRRLIRPLAPKLAGKLRLSKGKLPIDELIPHPIENMPVSKTHDLIVMINVIEHCQDLETIFSKILALSKPGSIFVFCDKYYTYPKIKEIITEQCFEAGHPLLADKSVVEGFLHSHFEPLYEKLIMKENDISGFDWSFDSVYFIGKRK